MRILTLSNLYPPDVTGGYEIVIKQSVDWLRSRGHEVHILTSAPRRPVPDEPAVHRRMRLSAELWDHDLLVKSNETTRFALQAEANSISSFNVHVLLETLRHLQPDVVYVGNVIGLGGLGMIGALQLSAWPWVWHLEDDVPRTICTFREQLHQGLTQEFNSRVRGEYILVSERLREELSTHGIALKGQCHLVPNWITGDPSTTRVKPSARGERFPRIVSVGRVQREKGSDLLIEAAAILRSLGHQDFEIDLIGEVCDQSLVQLANLRGLDGVVRFLGQRSHAEVQEAYQNHDVLVFPTWEREPFGLSPLEAAAHGCLPIISMNCGLAEWLVHGVHCLKVERSAESIASCLEGLINGCIDLGAAARRAQAVAWRDFHINRVVPRIESILRAAANHPRQTASDHAEIYQVAMLGEKLAQLAVQDGCPP